MESLFILIPIALLLVFVAIKIFLWAVKNGQFEDLDTEGKRILFDKDHITKTETDSSSSSRKKIREHDI